MQVTRAPRAQNAFQQHSSTYHTICAITLAILTVLARISTDCCISCATVFEHIPARPCVAWAPQLVLHTINRRVSGTFGTGNVRVVCIVRTNFCSSGFPGTDVSLGLTCVGMCLLPVRRTVCRSTKLKCCDGVPDAVSSDATICATRRSSDGARVRRCSLPTTRY